MRARPSGAGALLVTAVILTGLLIPGAAAQTGGGEPASGPEGVPAVVDLAEIPAEPPVQPARRPAQELFGADCDTEISGSQVTARCHNGYPETDLVRLHVECDRWWDVDGDGAAVAVGPAGRVELTGRCWKEVRSAWISHQRP
ncbi:hypothetical protein OG625_29880 [Streptomyces sp. NBC_01351]|uniref:hypothetical protein n=1 Tax=Streptomyces sp. NBC_01351 TaxID=2903833 RepID=UPI002E33C76E|nr:hypothetical protein [Streptomyces sp. NBC_01351]